MSEKRHIPTSQEIELSHIADKVIELADRVKVISALAPGAEASWLFELDDTRFELVVRVYDPQR